MYGFYIFIFINIKKTDNGPKNYKKKQFYLIIIYDVIHTMTIMMFSVVILIYMYYGGINQTM